MAISARKVVDIPGVAEKRAAQKAKKEAAKARKEVRAAASGKSFASMTRGEKDELLLELCVRFGLTDDDGKAL